MNSNAVRLRVHFAPVGFEVLRVSEPMKMLHADVALLLTFSQTDRARFQVEKIIEALNESRIQTKVVECNIWSTSEVVNEVGSIVAASPQHDYFFNVSTGTRTAGMAGVIAGMFWRIKPYYVHIDDTAKPVHSEQDFPTSGFPQFVPTFEIPVLDKASVVALEFIAGKQQPIPKRLLLEHLKVTGAVGPRQKQAVSTQALHGQVDSILQKLETWGFIDLSGRGKLLRITITEKGVEGRKMFFHVLNPRKPLSILSARKGE